MRQWLLGGVCLPILLYAGCENAGSTANSGRATPSSPPRNEEKKAIRHVPVLETVEPDEYLAIQDEVAVQSDSNPRFRPADRRPKHDDARLMAAGIHRYESKRLMLYTDIDADAAKTLPPIVDRLFDELVSYFGRLPPDEQGTEFQMTGYLIRDETLFRELGLLEGLPTLLHGKHLANQFWLREQQHAYFRRHLLLHECVHCYMTFVPGPIPPLWYMEGMAELFATHRLKPNGSAEFRILPTERDEMGGWGRINAIRTLSADGRALSIRGIYDLPHEAFFRPQAYAWSWGLCCFLDRHPRYRDRFRSLGRHLADGRFSQTFHDHFAQDERDLTIEWTLFEQQLQPGYDVERAAIELGHATPLAEGEERKLTIRADRGWQDVGLSIAADERYEVTATGRFSLGDDPKPWISEPQGISIDYFNGSPLGRLMACLDVDETVGDDRRFGPPVTVIPLGKSATWTAPSEGRLLLRLNDAWDSLADNSGEVSVTIRRLGPDKE